MTFSHCARWLALSVFILATVPALADVYRCEQSDRRVVYQDTPCATGTQKKVDSPSSGVPTPAASSAVPAYKIKRAELERDRIVQDAITSRRPMVSMTRAELDQAMGDPDKINSAQYGSSFQKQLIYYRNGRTLYVYTKDGVVTSVQDTQGTSSPQRKPCPSASNIWAIEVEISKIMNRDNHQLQTELHKQLFDAKACQ